MITYETSAKCRKYAYVKELIRCSLYKIYFNVN